jgi:hypothetical protein
MSKTYIAQSELEAQALGEGTQKEIVLTLR